MLAKRTMEDLSAAADAWRSSAPNPETVRETFAVWNQSVGYTRAAIGDAATAIEETANTVHAIVMIAGALLIAGLAVELWKSLGRA